MQRKSSKFRIKNCSLKKSKRKLQLENFEFLSTANLIGLQQNKTPVMAKSHVEANHNGVISCIMCATRFPGPWKHYIFTRMLIFYGLFMCLKKIQMLSYLTLCTCNFKCKVIIIFECTLGAFFINPFEQSLRLLSKYIAVFFMKSCKA